MAYHYICTIVSYSMGLFNEILQIYAKITFCVDLISSQIYFSSIEFHGRRRLRSVHGLLLYKYNGKLYYYYICTIVSYAMGLFNEILQIYTKITFCVDLISSQIYFSSIEFHGRRRLRSFHGLLLYLYYGKLFYGTAQ